MVRFKQVIECPLTEILAKIKLCSLRSSSFVIKPKDKHYLFKGYAFSQLSAYNTSFSALFSGLHERRN